MSYTPMTPPLTPAQRSPAHPYRATRPALEALKADARDLICDLPDDVVNRVFVEVYGPGYALR